MFARFYKLAIAMLISALFQSGIIFSNNDDDIAEDPIEATILEEEVDNQNSCDEIEMEDPTKVLINAASDGTLTSEMLEELVTLGANPQVQVNQGFGPVESFILSKVSWWKDKSKALPLIEVLVKKYKLDPLNAIDAAFKSGDKDFIKALFDQGIADSLCITTERFYSWLPYCKYVQGLDYKKFVELLISKVNASTTCFDGTLLHFIVTNIYDDKMVWILGIDFNDQKRIQSLLKQNSHFTEETFKRYVHQKRQEALRQWSPSEGIVLLMKVLMRGADILVKDQFGIRASEQPRINSLVKKYLQDIEAYASSKHSLSLSQETLTELCKQQQKRNISMLNNQHILSYVLVCKDTAAIDFIFSKYYTEIKTYFMDVIKSIKGQNVHSQVNIIIYKLCDHGFKRNLKSSKMPADVVFAFE